MQYHAGLRHGFMLPAKPFEMKKCLLTLSLAKPREKVEVTNLRAVDPWTHTLHY